MGALGIKTWEDLVKAAGKNPQGEAAKILKELFDSGLWLEELFKSLPIGYEREEVLIAQIVYPRPRCLRVGNDILSVLVVKMTIPFVFHDSSYWLFML